MKTNFLIFLVDDDPIFLKVLETQFKEQTDFEVQTFSTGEECLKNLFQKPDIILLDYYLNPENRDHTGILILDEIKAIDKNIAVAMLSSQHQIEVAVDCMKHEAFDYIVKSEGAFMRAQKAITILLHQKKLEKEVVFYRTSAITLEKMVEERTREVVEQRSLIEQKHKEITDSINYAENIQRSFLPSSKLLDDNLGEHFIFFKPKDIVSGDFYWASKLSNGLFALLTADSTGHGVPGALMSILNISCIEKAIEAEKLIEPSEILNHTRLKIIETLKKEGSELGGNDGMDCSLVIFDLKNKKLTYSAAHNPVWIVRQQQIIELASDNMPVGKHANDSIQFTQHTIDLHEGDIVYTFTDGMSDQFGGVNGKKFMKRQLKELLISISHLPLVEQKETLITSFEDWKTNLEQVDDITIIGIKI